MRTVEEGLKWYMNEIGSGQRVDLEVVRLIAYTAVKCIRWPIIGVGVVKCIKGGLKVYWRSRGLTDWRYTI